MKLLRFSPSLRLLFLTLSHFLFQVSAAACPLVTASLDYGTFQGAYSSKYNISYWQKIPFAAPPVGVNRFRAPQPPLPIVERVYDSTQSFDMCPQRTVNGSEDCLYLGLYGRPWTLSQPLRPVIVTFYGGGFIEGSAAFELPPPAYPILNVSTANDIIFVYPNYRVSAWGFLPGKEIAADLNSDFNNGLLDQQAAMQWVNKYISKFGGDPGNVTIWGQSAGGGSVLSHVIANGGKTKPPLFTKALASSPFWPKTYRYDASESQAIYDTFANLSGCGNAADSLACLKAADLQVLRTAALQITSLHRFTTSSFTWAPVIGDDFLPSSLTLATRLGQVNVELGMATYNAFEGENFIPGGLKTPQNSGTPPFNSSTASFESWLDGFIPKVGARGRRMIETLYPPSGSVEAVGAYSTSYLRAQLIYRDLVLACPALWMVGAAKQKGWLGEYVIPPAQHASDTVWWNQVNAKQTPTSITYLGFAGAFASFFQTGDPNTHKLTDPSVPGVPELLRTEEEFVIADNNTFENIAVNATGGLSLRDKCHFWRGEGPSLDI